MYIHGNTAYRSPLPSYLSNIPLSLVHIRNPKSTVREAHVQQLQYSTHALYYRKQNTALAVSCIQILIRMRKSALEACRHFSSLVCCSYGFYFPKNTQYMFHRNSKSRSSAQQKFRHELGTSFMNMHIKCHEYAALDTDMSGNNLRVVFRDNET